MINLIARVKTQVEYIDEDGDEVKRSLYCFVDVAGVPCKGDRVFLPTPRGYQVQEFKVDWVLFIGGLVMLAGETQNHYMDQEIYDDLLRIGYTTEKPAALLAAEESLSIAE